MQECTIRNLAEDGGFERFVVEQTADVLAQFHMAAETCASDDVVHKTSQWKTARFKARFEAGCFRSAFKALQLCDLTLVNGKVAFTSEITDAAQRGCVDVIDNLGSLLHELGQLGLKAQANILFNRYLDVTGGVLDDPYTLSALQSLIGQAESEGPPVPKLIAVGGLSGGGKSRMARMLAPLFEDSIGARVVRTDVVRKRMMGVALSDRLESHGYVEEKTTQTYQLFYRELATAIEQGQSAIADGVFALETQRQEVEDLAKRLGVPFVGLWVDAPIDVRTKRVASRKNNVSDVTETVLQRQLSYDLGKITWHKIDSSGPKQETLSLGRRLAGV